MKRLTDKWYLPEFAVARLVVYAVLFFAGIYVVFFDKTFYLCNLEGKGCPLCGMKTAIYCVLKLQFSQAHKSNPMVWVFFIIAAAMITDIILSIIGLRERKI